MPSFYSLSYRLKHSISNEPNFGDRGKEDLCVSVVCERRPTLQLRILENPRAYEGPGVHIIIGNRSNGYWLPAVLNFRGWPFPFWPMFIYACYAVGITVLFLQLNLVTDKYKDKYTGLNQAMALINVALFFMTTSRVNSAYARWVRFY
jgi:hypothetical protein